MPKISVIIPVYNTEKYLIRCLDSVLNQTLPDIEVICVNDCSVDNSLEILRNYAKKDNRIKIINFEENKGAAVARNTAMEEAQGEYIGFVDSDDFIDLDFYEKLYKRAIENDSDITKSNLKLINNPTEDNSKPYHNIADVRKNKILLNHIPTAIFKTSFISSNGLFFPEIKCMEDAVFETKVGILCNKIEIVEDTFYNYVWRNDSLNNTEKYNKEKISAIIKSTSLIFDILNNADIDKASYLEAAVFRYKCLSDFYIDKCEDEDSKKLIKETEDKIFKTIKYKNEFKWLLNGKPNYSNILGQLRKKTDSIAKRIFYVWFGADKPSQVNICIENWKKMLPEYEIIEVNENSPYFDFKKEYENCLWFRTVYDLNLWAFVSDYVRCKVLYDHGGIYLDTDVTIYKDFSPLLNCKMFLGEEVPGIINCAIMGAIKGHNFLSYVIDFYKNEIFKSPLYTIPTIFTKIANDKKYEGLTIYPPEYFYPYYYDEKFSPECITENTYAVHWWDGSWNDEKSLNFLNNKHKMPLDKLLEPFNPRVSVIMPIYEVEEYLHKCLESVISQTYKNLQIICVYDKSPDKSGEILEAYAQKDSRIQIVYSKEKKGLSAARNLGYKYANGEYVYFIDSDDWIDSDYIEKMVKAAIKSDSDIVLNTNIMAHEEGKEPYKFSSEDLRREDINHQFIKSESNIFRIIWNTWAHLWKKSFLDKINVKFPEGYNAEDMYFQSITYFFTNQVYIIQDSIYHYTVRKQSFTGKFSSQIGKEFEVQIQIHNKIYEFFEEKGLVDVCNSKMFTEGIIFQKVSDKRKKYEIIKDYFLKIEKIVMRTKSLYSELELLFFDDIINDFEKALKTNYQTKSMFINLRKKIERRLVNV